MAIEDAAALGILFNERCFRGDIDEALAVYDQIRLPRATRVQAAAAKAAYNINERIGKQLLDFSMRDALKKAAGFSNNKNIATYKVEDEKKKLTVEEMNA
jgi:salicylate hydroxylase